MFPTGAFPVGVFPSGPFPPPAPAVEAPVQFYFIESTLSVDERMRAAFALGSRVLPDDVLMGERIRTVARSHSILVPEDLEMSARAHGRLKVEPIEDE